MKSAHGTTAHPPERRSEACAGTIQYCREGFFRDFGEDFINEEECLESRDPETGGARPVTEPEPAAITSAATTPVTTPASAPPASTDLSKKKPFLHSDLVSSPRNCGVSQMIKSPKSRSEACAGTVKYCREGFFRDFDESFSNEAECLESRDPPSLRPFKTGRPTERACVDRPGNRRKAQSEDCVGTAQYCSQGYFRVSGEDFANEEECLKSRNPASGAAPPVIEPEPAATAPATAPASNSSASAPPASASLSKKPFKLRGGTPTSCGLLIGDPRAHSEACFGTVLYCRNEFFREFGENISSEEECLQSRTRPSRRRSQQAAPQPASVDAATKV
ncbi:hypothetical protein BBO_09330 [Beauveria brongniartii RCEF 3172]|uniref:Uncharacterized protein n=1 Tax=Beauveria brongniartii RCEF 3172 TaxID=1081107 RepID=A0A166VWH8_9HYPO|nr:hypothetical protein BBO_09330 [Beauveria brongniartii RCEF 3172]